MSRGRKPKSRNNVLNWQQLFNKNVGAYFQIICLELGSKTYMQDVSASELHNQTKVGKEQARNEKELLPIKQEEIPFEIPKTWTWCRLGQIITMIYGDSLTKVQCQKNGQYPVFGSNGIVGYYDEYLTDKRSIVIGRKGSAGALNKCNVPSWTTDVAYYVEEDKNISFDFLFFLLKSLGLENLGKGIKPGLNRNEAYNIPIPLPTPSEQLKISEFLNDFENNNLKADGVYFNNEVEQTIISLHKSQVLGYEISFDLTYQLSLVKQLRQAFLRESMQGKLVKQDPGDEPASELLKKIKAEKEQLVKENKIKKGKELSPVKPEETPFEIPENWVWCRLGQVFTKITDGTHHSPANMATGAYKYVTAKNIKDYGVELGDITYVTKKVHQEIFSRCNPELDDILYIKDGATTGVVTINNLTEEFSMLSSVALLKVSKSVSNSYLMYCLRSPFFYEATRDDMQGVAITRVTLTKLQNAMLPLPPLPEQHRIVAKLEQLMQFCDQLGQSIKHSQTQNEQLLHQVLREALQPKESHNQIAEIHHG